MDSPDHRKAELRAILAVLLAAAALLALDAALRRLAPAEPRVASTVEGYVYGAAADAGVPGGGR